MHTLPAHLTLGEPQSFSWGTLTNTRLNIYSGCSAQKHVFALLGLKKTNYYYYYYHYNDDYNDELWDELRAGRGLRE